MGEPSIATGRGVPVTAGTVRLASVRADRPDGLYTVEFDVTTRAGRTRRFRGPARPDTVVDYRAFARVALKNHRVLARHPAAEKRGAAGAAAWRDELQDAIDAGAGE